MRFWNWVYQFLCQLRRQIKVPFNGKPRGYRPESHVFDQFKFSRFFPVVFGCSLFDSALFSGCLSKLHGFLASNLLNGTLVLLFCFLDHWKFSSWIWHGKIKLYFTLFYKQTYAMFFSAMCFQSKFGLKTSRAFRTRITLFMYHK